MPSPSAPQQNVCPAQGREPHGCGLLDLTIRSVETYALLGPNGAGKSTTIEILEGHRKPDSVEVTVSGPALESRTILPGQNRHCPPGRQPTPVSSGSPRPRSLAACFPAPRPVDEVIEAVGLGGKGGVRISTLSGVQRRRLDVALGIIGNPEVLFLDEPTTGFEPESPAALLGLHPVTQQRRHHHCADYPLSGRS